MISELDQALSGLIAKFGIVKTASILKNLNEKLQYFEGKTNLESVQQAVISEICAYFEITEKEFFESRKHIISDARALAMFFFADHMSMREIAHFFKRDLAFCQKRLSEITFLLKNKTVNFQILNCYDRLRAQLYCISAIRQNPAPDRNC
jgi:chromosomal replication initiation ATPase DnaA